jgi:hypothetical protein
LENCFGVESVRLLQVNSEDYKDIQRGQFLLDLKIECELVSFSMIRIKHFGNNTCRYCLGTATMCLIK